MQRPTIGAEWRSVAPWGQLKADIGADPLRASADDARASQVGSGVGWHSTELFCDYKKDSRTLETRIQRRWATRAIVKTSSEVQVWISPK